ncbi:hypothetical protein [Streptomyces sp. NPDC047841]|uniref:hypothetical protein n=1 Tax=Streptomyces sp. NPDC047841 TaxID=3154708 RepID=UPI0034550423
MRALADRGGEPGHPPLVVFHDPLQDRLLPRGQSRDVRQVQVGELLVETCACDRLPDGMRLASESGAQGLSASPAAR